MVIPAAVKSNNGEPQTAAFESGRPIYVRVFIDLCTVIAAKTFRTSSSRQKKPIIGWYK
jgi:hypothetical protein